MLYDQNKSTLLRLNLEDKVCLGNQIEYNFEDINVKQQHKIKKTLKKLQNTISNVYRKNDFVVPKPQKEMVFHQREKLSHLYKTQMKFNINTMTFDDIKSNKELFNAHLYITQPNFKQSNYKQYEKLVQCQKDLINKNIKVPKIKDNQSEIEEQFVRYSNNLPQPCLNLRNSIQIQAKSMLDQNDESRIEKVINEKIKNQRIQDKIIEKAQKKFGFSIKTDIIQNIKKSKELRDIIASQKEIKKKIKQFIPKFQEKDQIDNKMFDNYSILKGESKRILKEKNTKKLLKQTFTSLNKDILKIKKKNTNTKRIDSADMQEWIQQFQNYLDDIK